MSWKNLYVAKDLIESLKLHAKKNGYCKSEDYSVLFQERFIGVSLIEYLEVEVRKFFPFLSEENIEK